MAIYPAYVHVDKDGSASGYFPDVTGCIFATNPGENIHQEALSALEAHFELLAIDGISIPEPHEMPYHVVQDVTAYHDGQWYNVMVDMTKFSGKSERINITLPHRLVHQIDDYVKNHNSQYASRSAFLAEIARRELSNHR